MENLSLEDSATVQSILSLPNNAELKECSEFMSVSFENQSTLSTDTRNSSSKPKSKASRNSVLRKADNLDSCHCNLF